MGLLFWTFMIASLALAIVGIRSEKSKFLVISSVLILPLSLYLSATPLFEVWGIIFPLFFVGAAISLAKRLRWLAVLLVIPNFLLIGWIGISVLTV